MLICELKNEQHWNEKQPQISPSARLDSPSSSPFRNLSCSPLLSLLFFLTSSVSMASAESAQLSSAAAEQQTVGLFMFLASASFLISSGFFDLFFLLRYFFSPCLFLCGSEASIEQWKIKKLIKSLVCSSALFSLLALLTSAEIPIPFVPSLCRKPLEGLLLVLVNFFLL